MAHLRVSQTSENGTMLPVQGAPRLPLFTPVFVKVAIWGLLIAATRGWSDFDEQKFGLVMVRWPQDGGPAYASHFATWDAAHYLHLSEVGYQHSLPSCAFYPLWPLLVRWASPLAGGSHLVTALVLANGFSLAAWVLFHRLVARRWGAGVANWSLVFLIAFPGSLFFQFNYSESLFLLLVLVLWWALEEQRYGWAFLAAGLLPLTRGVGVFAVLPIGWHALEPVRKWLAARERNEPKAAAPLSAFSAVFRGGLGEEGARRDAGPTGRSRAWLLAAPLLGWGVYLGLMWHWTGNPFEGFEAQKYWRVHSVSNLWNVPKFVVGLFTPTEWHEFRGSVLDRCVFLMLVDCLVLIWRLDKGLLVWTYMLGILPAMSGTFTSYTRFASCAFPLFIALGVFSSAEGGVRSAESPAGPQTATFDSRRWSARLWLRNGLLAVFIVLHVMLVWRFVNFRWAG